ncbi:MAG: hypothetical protein M3Z10_09860 [Gemmatimonadota bacterium]|nr:hypothetical protein [Gemmatimonadota bacterium]
MGEVLMGFGVALGAALALALVGGHWFPWLTSLPWLAAVGLAKLTFIGAVGLLASGAVLRRLAIRADERALPPPGR